MDSSCEFVAVTISQRESELAGLIMKVIKQGLEGLVLKDTKVSRLSRPESVCFTVGSWQGISLCVYREELHVVSKANQV